MQIPLLQLTSYSRFKVKSQLDHMGALGDLRYLLISRPPSQITRGESFINELSRLGLGWGIFFFPECLCANEVSCYFAKEEGGFNDGRSFRSLPFQIQL